MNSAVVDFIKSLRVARLATVDAENRPDVVPICFAYGEGGVIYSAIDAKPKKTSGNNLKRITNIFGNSSVSIVFDRYLEEWDQLGYVIVHGLAHLITTGEERDLAEILLRNKYSQYETYLSPGAPIIKILVDRHVSWGDIHC